MQLRPIREARGFSIATIAELMSVGQNTVSRWETGEREPGIATLQKLCEIYDCTLDELVNGLNPTPRPQQTAGGAE